MKGKIIFIDCDVISGWWIGATNCKSETNINHITEMPTPPGSKKCIPHLKKSVFLKKKKKSSTFFYNNQTQPFNG